MKARVEQDGGERKNEGKEREVRVEGRERGRNHCWKWKNQ